MQEDVLLTQDELDYIQDVQQSPQFAVVDALPSLLVNGDSRVQNLLTRLVADEQVTLQAHFNNQQISFPLQVIEDEFHTLHLQLGAPEIYEDGPRLRPWRLSLDHPIALLNADGQPSGLWVCDISFKGVLVELRGLPEAPEQFELQFAPGDIEPIELKGTQRRQINGTKAAYHLGRSAAEDIERLRDYILQAHSRVHPELHTQPAA